MQFSELLKIVLVDIVSLGVAWSVSVLQRYKVTVLQFCSVTGRAGVTDFTASFPSPGGA